ncbi:MAG: insulinase family protein [Lentisphaerales bacterium]|nr:MAG: insulinase family protein [Lentisphaerales bacterium]
MVCLVRADHSAPVVAVQIWVRTGSMHEGKYCGSGLSHYVEHMIFKGTELRRAGDISREISDAGGFINAYTAQDRTVIYATLPSKSWKTAVDVLVDAMFNAMFPEDEWEREKEVILREFAMGRDDPNRVINKLLWRTAFVEHPARYPVIGEEELFRSVGREELMEYFRSRYVPENMIAVVVGDVDESEVERELRRLCGSVRRAFNAPVVLPAEPRQVSARSVRQKGPWKISRVECTYHTVPFTHEDVPALDVLSEVVGGGRSSRIAVALKEEQKIVHSISAWSYTPREFGLFGISAIFDPDNEAAVTAAIQQQVELWRTKELDQEEVRKAVRILTVRELSRLQDMGGQANSYAAGEFYANAPGFSVTYLRRLNEVTTLTLKDVAARYLSVENRTVALLVPESPGSEREAPAVSHTDVGEVTKVLLPNGVPMIIREDHRLPFVHICAAFGGGLLSEDEMNNGIGKLMSEMMVRGTGNRSSESIALETDQLGASLWSFSGRNSFGLQGRCLSSDLVEFFDLYADCLLDSRFPREEVEKQKSVLLEAIEQQYESPMYMAQESLAAIIHTNHPYRWSELGTKERVSGLTESDLEAHYGRHVTTGNVVIAVFGDIDPVHAREIVWKRLQHLRPGPTAVRGPTPQIPQLPARVVIPADKEQTIFLAGYPGVSVDDPVADVLAVLSRAMSGLSSDLAMEIRDKRGLVYYVGAYNRAGVDPGVFAIYAGLKQEHLEELEHLVDKEIQRLANEGLRGEEIERAKRQIIASYEMSLQNNDGYALESALNELYGLGYDYGETTKARIDAISVEDVKRAVSSILAATKKAVSVLIPSGEREE